MLRHCTFASLLLVVTTGLASCASSKTKPAQEPAPTLQRPSTKPSSPLTSPPTLASGFFAEPSAPDGWTRLGLLGARLPVSAVGMDVDDDRLLLSLPSDVEVRRRRPDGVDVMHLDGMRHPARLVPAAGVVGVWDGALVVVDVEGQELHRWPTGLAFVHDIALQGDVVVVVGQALDDAEKQAVVFVSLSTGQASLPKTTSRAWACAGFAVVDEGEGGWSKWTSTTVTPLSRPDGSVVDVACHGGDVAAVTTAPAQWVSLTATKAAQPLPEDPLHLFAVDGRWLWSSTTGRLRQLDTSSTLFSGVVASTVMSAMASPLGTVVLHDDVVTVVDDQLQPQHNVGHRDRITDIRFADDDTVWTTSSDGTLRQWSRQGEQLAQHEPPAELGGVWRVRLHPDQNHAVVLSSPATVTKLALTTLTVAWSTTLPVPPHALADVDLSNDGSRVFALTGKEVLVVDDVDGNVLLRRKVRTPFNPQSGVTLLPVASNAMFVKLDPDKNCRGPSIYNPVDDTCTLLPRVLANGRWFALAANGHRLWMASPKANATVDLTSAPLPSRVDDGKTRPPTMLRADSVDYDVDGVVQRVLPLDDDRAVLLTRNGAYGVWADGRRAWGMPFPFAVRVRAADLSNDGRTLALAADVHGQSREERARFRRLAHLIALPAFP